MHACMHAKTKRYVVGEGLGVVQVDVAVRGLHAVIVIEVEQDGLVVFKQQEHVRVHALVVDRGPFLLLLVLLLDQHVERRVEQVVQVLHLLAVHARRALDQQRGWRKR